MELCVQFQFAAVFLVVTFLGAKPLYAALGDASHCPVQGQTAVGDLNLPIPLLSAEATNYSPEERDYLIRTIVFEADSESDKGKAAVAHVILNREKIGKWGDSIKEVVTSPWQFEPWMTRRKEIKSLSKTDPRYRNAARIADAALNGDAPDPTAGATHFLNPTIVRQRRGGSLPRWARGEGQPIGRHTFYSPYKSKSVPLEAVQLSNAGADISVPRSKADTLAPSGAMRSSCHRPQIATAVPTRRTEEAASK
jgi:hypothetical protein